MKIKKTHLNTFDQRLRDFSAEWDNTNMSAMHNILYQINRTAQSAGESTALHSCIQRNNF